MSTPEEEVLEVAREEAHERLERIERNLLSLETESVGAEVLDEMFRDAHSIKGAASMVGWDEVSEIAHAMEDRLAECRERGSFPPALADPLLRAADALRQVVAGRATAAGTVIEELSDGTAPEVATAPPRDHAAEAAAAPDASVAAGSRSIRIAAERIDRVLDGVGEAVLQQRRLRHSLSGHEAVAADEQAGEQLDSAERLLGDLQDSVVALRTLPLESITGRFPRAVRDLALEEGKEVELTIAGADTPLDRVILDGLQDTITHLFRNSVAHGIEQPDVRERAGKPRQGRIELRAEQRGETVAVEVADDGRGVSAETLEGARASGEPLIDVLSAAGFSTAPEVSGVAGRGVGLDAVKTHVEGLGGSLELSSEPGEGTTVTMVLPLTLAVLDVLLCERGGQPFALPVASVREVIAVHETTSLGGNDSVELRGEAVPMRDLARLIGAEAEELPVLPTAMVLGAGGRRIAVGCDLVLGDQEVVMKGLGPLLSHVPGYLGAAILGDGRVALVLDPNQLQKASAAGAPATRIKPPVVPSTAPTVLVVDDQFTVRELQRSILETAGYGVRTAADGRQALERVRADPDLALVLTDLQMPEMDGIELLRAIRRDPERGSLPVVIVTAMGTDDDRRRGVEEGADAYIVKQEFDQQTLLETVQRLIGA